VISFQTFPEKRKTVPEKKNRLKKEIDPEKNKTMGNGTGRNGWRPDPVSRRVRPKRSGRFRPCGPEESGSFTNRT
jgi:hypothetical protein